MRVAIIGAGFGGLNAARALKGADVEVTLIDRNNFHTFQPLLYQVATSGLNAADVAHPVRGVFWKQDNVAFRNASVTGVDWEEKVLTLDDGDPVAFDGLIVAAGAGTNFFGVPGAAEHSFPLYSLADALGVRNHLLSRVEWAQAHPGEADAALTWVIVGGGPTGVEMAGALAELVHHVLRKDFPDLDLDRRSRIVLVELADRLLTPFDPKLSENARRTLEKRNVEVRLDQQVESVTEDEVTLAGGEHIPTNTVVWAAGVKANPLVDRLGLPLGPGGRVVVDGTLGVPGHPNVYAVGDVAVIPGEDGRPLPGIAQVAIQSGKHAARQLTRTFGRAGRPEPFRYKDKGIMATIGRRAAVAQFPNGFTLRGTLGWWSWLGLHLVYLIGFRNRLSVMVNWTWNYFTWDRGPRLILWTDRRRRSGMADRTSQRSGLSGIVARPTGTNVARVPDADQIRATVQRYAEVFSAGDKEAYVGLFADDATLEDPVGGEVHRGQDAISAFWDATRQMTPEIELTLTGPVRVAGNEAAFPGEARPTIGEDRMVIPVVDVLAFDDAGRITRVRAFWDFADLRPAD